MLTELNIRVSESVPRDEAWFCERQISIVEVTPTGFAVTERFKVLGKIIRISGSISNRGSE